MELIEGYAAAKARLTRKPSPEFDQVSPGVKTKLQQIFGKAITPEEAVAQILRDVKAKGDSAVLDYTFKIDGFKLTILEISRKQIKDAYNQVEEELVSALILAGQRIRDFHQEQKDSLGGGVNGKEWGQLIRPLERAGLYAPGGTATYPSTVLMTCIPPRVAGVKEVVLCTPPRNNGTVPAATLIAADIAGVDRVFGIGGAQAIGAMAYGTESVPRVDKICGPGNLFVVLAKKAVFGSVGIDALQGPSEVVIIADASTNPAWCAADLLAQSEHDPQTQVVLISTSKKLADAVQKELAAQLALLPRHQIAAESLEKRGLIAVVKILDQAIELANRFAPEHLELMLKDADSYLDRITNAGCVFVGEISAVPFGDYVAGPNHSLPTGGTARFSSPLNVLDFLKIIDVVRMNRTGIKKLGQAAITIARSEGLEAHARAIEKRLKT
jgi:histidinol dehydrogenase